MAGRSGALALLKMGDGGSPETFATVAEQRDIDGPNITRDTIDVSNRVTRWREKRGGMVDAGQVKLEANHIPSDTSHAALLAALDSDDPVNYQYDFQDDAADPTIWQFSGILVGYEISDPMDDASGVTFTFEVTGKPNFAA